MNKLKLLTYNILFDEKDILHRTRAIIDIILNEEPDIIALQEVTPVSYTIIKTNTQLNKIYKINKVHFGEIYGTLILSKIPFDEADCIEMTHTEMGRKLEYIILNINGEKFIIATIHWESQFPTYKDKTEHAIKKKITTKISQYIESFVHLNKMKDYHIILMGDTNITNKEEHILTTPENYIDIYQYLNTDQVLDICNMQHTYDYKRNKLVKGKYQSRLDRIYYRNNTTNKDWLPVSYSFVGQNILDITEKHPSDHFGVVVEIRQSDEI